MGAATKSTFGNKLLGGSYRKRHCHKPWFDVDCHTAKRELRLLLKANPDSHAAKHQESKFKNLLKRKKLFRETTRAQHMCALAKEDALYSRKSTGQGHPLWTRSMQLHFWRAFAH
jgi:hypothetical protein